MSKIAPTFTQIAVIALFTLSCFGLLLYLWLAFGGPTPLLAQSYQLKVSFPEATQVATQADVRISGVTVGKVQSLELAPDGERTLATIELDNEFGPVPEDTRAMLRSKTLLSEAYVELTPGDPDAPKLDDGDRLADGQVARSIQLDEIMRTFDPETRRAWRTWMQDSASGAAGQGLAFNNALGGLQPTFTEFDSLLRTLDSQGAAVRRLFRDGAVSFRALSRQPGQFSGMIENFNRVFETTAQRNRDLEEMFMAFPTFLDESRATANRFAEFSVDTEPLMRQLIPVATELSGTFRQFGRIAPEFKSFFQSAAPVIRRAPRAFPALRKIFRDDFPPLLRAVPPFLHGINPLIEVVGDQRRELAGFVGNVSAALQGRQPGIRGSEPLYLRTLAMLNAEGYSTFNNRLTSNRNNSYVKPGQYLDVGEGGLLSFNTSACEGGGIRAELDPDTASDPAFADRVAQDEEPPEEGEEEEQTEAEEFFENIQRYAFNGSLSTDTIPAARCEKQGKYRPIGVEDGPPVDYPQVWNGR
ncbi:MAG TPA: MlaD family protein [Solirubrobacterales bacterium]|nr:MlaD family protein [Solirubrobacterales bacterium]